MLQPMGSHVSSFISAANRQHDEQSESCGFPGASSVGSATRLHGPHRCSIVVDGTDVVAGIDTTIKDTKGISILYSTSNSVLESTYDSSSTRAPHDDTAIKHRPSALAVVRSETRLRLID
jgi:hypothetical protein